MKTFNVVVRLVVNAKSAEEAEDRVMEELKKSVFDYATDFEAEELYGDEEEEAEEGEKK